MWFTRVSISNPVLATMAMAAILVLGLFSYQRLSVEQFPRIDFPVVVVNTQFPGASPESVEFDVSRRMEQAINAIGGLKTLTSRSYEGQSVVVAEFDLEVDPLQAMLEVREKVAAIRAGLPREAEEPVSTRYDPDEYPVLSLVLESGQRDLRALTTLAEKVVARRLESVGGVGRVGVVGGTSREVLIYLDAGRMEAFGVGVDEVVTAIRNENRDFPAGALVDGATELQVQVKGRISQAADFSRLIVARRGGSPIHLWQVAQVRDGQAEEENAALIDGRRVLTVDVVKAQGANTLEVVADVHRTLKRLESELPGDVKIRLVRDTPVAIRAAIDDVRRTIIEGGVLTVLIVFLFLGSWRSTVITGLTLPIALIGVFTLMLALDFSLNTMTLMAMSLSVGLLIDDAIVVRENIVRHVRLGKTPRQAALEGTREIGLAVLATTFTLCAVFVPVAFMGGIIGRFFYPFGMVVAGAVLLSMLVSFTLDPMLSSVWHDPPRRSPGRNPLARVLDRLLAGFEAGYQAVARGYEGLVAWSLARPRTVLALAAASFAGGLALIPLVGTEFVPEADSSELVVHVNTAPGASLEYTGVKVRQATEALRAFPETSYVYATLNTGFVVGKNQAVLFVNLKPAAERGRGQAEMVRQIRQRLTAIAGLEVTQVGPYSALSGNKPIQVSIQGQDLAVLDALSRQVLAGLAAIPGTVDVESSLKAERPTLEIRLNREAASDLGLGAADVAAALRPLIAGEAVGAWEAPDGERYDVRVRLDPESRQDQADLDNLRLATRDEGKAALAQIAEMVPVGGATRIDRRDQRREVLVTADVDARPLGAVIADLEARLAGIPAPAGYRLVLGGASEDMDETSSFAVQALLLGVVFIYMILAAQFKSFLQPAAIMLALPLALVGVVLALLATGSTLNVFSAIGLIMLMGLVTKNGILLVDFINQARERGLSRAAAIVESARVRLRPILMTTAAMVFGMLPLALGAGEGADQRAPMAHAVIGGVLASTFLTLLVVPVVYGYLDDLAAAWHRWRGKTTAGTPTSTTPVEHHDPRNLN